MLLVPAAEPRELLELARCCERVAERERTVRWGPRTLDVDVIACGDVRSDDPEIMIPHPRAHEPAFVVVRLPVGAPVAPFAVPTAPSLVMSAPMNDATVIEPT